MPDIFIYLIKANLAIILFYLGYRLLLRQLTFYHLNRFYLLFALLFSALYPLADVQGWFAERQVAVTEVVYVLPEWDVAPVEQFNPWPYVSVLVWAVAGFFGLRFLVRLLSLWAIHRQSSPAQWRLFRYRQVFRQVSPFSFWRTIYLNTQQHGPHELEDIFHHEQVHVDELHTVDILLVEACSVLCWFNPGAWLMRHAVRENLEFITDRRVLQSGMDKKAYQYSLLKASTGQYNPALASNFNLKSIKRRIAMMNSGRSSRLHLGKYLFVVPAIALFVLVFTITKAQQDRSAGGETAMNGEAIPVSGVQADSIRIEGVVMPTDNDTSGQPVVRSATDTLTVQLLGAGHDSIRTILRIAKGDSAREVVSWGTITYRKVSPDSTGGKLFVALSDSQGLTRLEPSQIELIEQLRLKQGASERGALTLRGVLADSTGRQPLIVLDGVQASEGVLSRLEPSQIKRIEVLKDAAATTLYGEKGRPGVILVTTKVNGRGANGASPSLRALARTDSLAISGRGSVRLNGDTIRIEPSMHHVFKHSLSGDTVIVTPLMERVFAQATRANAADSDSSLREVIVIGAGSSVPKEASSDFQNALILIDGKQATSAQLRALSPNEIKHMSVLKDASATEKHGDKGKNGVIEVELEKK